VEKGYPRVFAEIEATYVADGHHAVPRRESLRSSQVGPIRSTAINCLKLFPDGDLPRRSFENPPYNRVVTDLNRLTTQAVAGKEPVRNFEVEIENGNQTR